MADYFLSAELPRVAVLVAAFNGIEWIDEQLQSILQQRGVAVSLLISVDNSTDGTLERCQAYASEHPNISVTPPGGPFGCAARNFFYLFERVDLDEFDYVALSDQDDLWHDDKLLRAVTHLSRSGDGGYSSNVTAFWPDQTTLLLKKSQPQVKYDYLFEAGGPGCTYVLPVTSALPLQAGLKEAQGPLWEVNFHDWYIYSWVRSSGLRWHIDANPSMNYRQHPKNQLGANTSIKSMLSRWREVGSGGWFKQVKLIARLTGPAAPPAFYRYLSFSRSDLLHLAAHAPQCRRRRRDQLLFFIVCILCAVRGGSST